jgi:carnitine O-acetyltransferase
MDSEHRPVLSERELWSNLCTIIQDADKLPISKVAQSSIGLLTTERRPTWAALRQAMIDDPNSSNKECLKAIDSALFIVCLDGSSPRTADAICATMLCGTYELGRRGVQVGTCLNRWYDKLQIIVCADGQAGVNFEHSAVDGHTVLRFVGDVYTELILRFAKSINSNSRTLFKALPSPWAKPTGKKNLPNSSDQADLPPEDITTTPKKLEWQLSNTLKASIRFAETRLSDLICQNEVLALEFEEYGKNFIISQNLSPDAVSIILHFFLFFSELVNCKARNLTESIFAC